MPEGETQTPAGGWCRLKNFEVEEFQTSTSGSTSGKAGIVNPKPCVVRASH